MSTESCVHTILLRPIPRFKMGLPDAYIQSARLNGHDPYAYLKDVLTRLPTHKASRIGELLPHRWQAPTA